MNGRQYASRFLWGLFIVAIGSGFLLKQFGIVDFDIGDIASTYWPVALMFAGLNGLLFASSVGSAIWSGGVMFSIGFIFLGRNLDWFEWSVGDLMRFVGPVILIMFGLNMIFKPKHYGKREYNQKDDWQPYKPTGYVPPAPPLHPDPTMNPGAPGPEAPEGPIPPHPPTGPNLRKEPTHNYESRHAQHLADRMNRHQQKIERKMERIHQKIQRHAGASYRKHHNPWERVEWWDSDPNTQTRSGFIGDIHIGNDHWELKPLNISHFVGDTVLDLTKAQIPPGETKITISSFIGDVKIYLPNDYEVGIHVVSSAFIGDARVLDMRDSRVFRSMDVESPYYKETEKRIKLVCSTFIGDVRVTKVG
ncbi:cell wall-active antibiotics response protein LiaF [Paenibacillus sp. MMS18-CY102]|uniref:cell wall-active antibiotics response protein LiaF n=1 Tax=Paenibacillus sp. MMS18-CY102 TaxID=2682849 RepID=UPI001F27EE1F|nr:cell wall-active antibiotics response protein LiaF [Paenibacillus sp. MMS18-CY102]